MTSRRPWALILVAAMVFGACSSDGDGQDSSQELRDAVESGPPSTTTTESAVGAPDPALAELDGLIATTDRAGLQLRDPATGEIEAEFISDGFATQPTWSRDGTQVVRLRAHPGAGDG